MAGDQLHGALAKLVALHPFLDPAVEVGEQPGQEMRLGRDRQLRMCVEHQPKKRRAGACDPDHERRREPRVGGSRRPDGQRPFAGECRSSSPMGAVTLTRLVDRLRPWNEPLEIPECPRGWETGPPDLRGDRLAALWDQLVVRLDAPPPADQALTAGEGGPLLRPFLARRRPRRHRIRVRLAVSPPAGAARRRVDPALPRRLLVDPPPPAGGS